ncbi:putative leucine-rich repeat-containing protein DDB_G0290503 [Xenopus laevis]|uniref:Leucine-rich repeat-containing protein DDB_G0290503 n=2 Tax=Xenopus laevis TaxID=8355 RepID=A0A1L8H026_XENLA|nr:putative leucine-rich repeat-containing protein DDB_G0290503 [Xenopus laevis]OCT89454.1 hypothetical protein XELAEV_18018075mg [Xenopus laevis]
MSYRVCNGYVSLPSRYGTGGSSQHHVDSGRISPCWSYKDLGSSRHGLELSKSPVLSDLEKNIETAVNLESSFLSGQWKDYSRSSVSPRHSERAKSTSPIRGIHSLEYSRIQSSPPISRRNSLSRLPTSSSEDFSLELPLSRRGWSGSEMDLRASLTESAQKRADLVQRLRDTQVKLEGQSEELQQRDKELEFSRAKIELLAVKQKQLETSISQLEKEKGWLEVSRYEDKRQRGELQDRIINLEMEVMKTKSNLENLNYTNIFKDQKTPMENDELNRELRTVRENLLYLRNRVKVLEAEKNQAVVELKILREGSQQAFSQTNEANQRVTDTLRAHQDLQEELSNLQLNFNTTSLEKELTSTKIMRLEEKVKDLDLRLNIAQSDRERFLQDKLELNKRNQELSLELERAQRGREGFNDQVSDLHIELVGAKSQANRQDQEKVQMKEELVMLKQVNEKLATELGQTQHKLQSTLDELHQLQAEHKISTNLTTALEAERAQLLGEKELLMSTVEEHGESQTIQELRSSQAQLIEERDNLCTRGQNLQVSLEQAHEQLGSQIQEQQQLTLYWKERWQQTAVNLKSTEEQLEQAKAQYQSTTNKNSEILQDYELLQADAEELAELRMAISSLKKENNLLKEQIKEQEQNKHLQHLQSHIQANVDSTEDVNLKLAAMYSELQQAHERLKLLEREKSEKELEIIKLKTESGSILRIELDACKQQLELERSRTTTMQAKIAAMESRNKMEVANNQVHRDRVDSLQNQSWSLPSERLTSDELSSEIENLHQQLQEERDAKKKKEELIFNLKEELDDLKHKKPGEIKASLEEMDSELIFVREELQKVWDMLKTKDTELEEQYQELESARGQYTECSTEKVRLEQVVASLQQQLAEKEQMMKHFKQMREMEKTEMDIEKSSLKLKLAELQGQKGDVTPQTVQQIEGTGPKWWRSKGTKVVESSKKCIRCEAFLQQLDETIKGCQESNTELQEEKNQTLESLYQLQEVLTNLSKQSKVNEQVAQSLQVDNNTLKNQHRLVTEQLKCLFKEKELLGEAYNKLPKEDKPTEDWNVQSRLVKNVHSSINSHKKQQEELTEETGDHPEKVNAFLVETNKTDMRNLQRQLKEKSEQISKMASEMKLLQEKNESLMKAKMRFQQQVQQIRSVSHLDPQREMVDPAVPPLSGDTSHHKKDKFLASESQDSSRGVQGTQASFQSYSEGSWTSSPQSSRPQTPISPKVMPPASLLRLQLPGTVGKHWVKSKVESPLSPRSLVDSEGSRDNPGSVTPRASALLSPRPFHPPNSAQAFRYGKNVQHTNS